jgi:hypothetical protein
MMKGKESNFKRGRVGTALLAAAMALMLVPGTGVTVHAVDAGETGGGGIPSKLRRIIQDLLLLQTSIRIMRLKSQFHFRQKKNSWQPRFALYWINQVFPIQRNRQCNY